MFIEIVGPSRPSSSPAKPHKRQDFYPGMYTVSHETCKYFDSGNSILA